MAEQSEISWTHATLTRHCVLLAAALGFWNWLKMDFLMAILAKRDAVARLIAKFWKVCKTLDVMGIKVAAPSVAAVLASVGVAFKNSSSPILIFNSAAFIQIALVLSVFIGIVILAACRAFACNLTDSCFRFGGVWLSGAIRSPKLCRRTHLKPGFCRVGSPLEDGWPTLHVFPDFHASALMAFCIKSVMSSAILAEVRLMLPSLTFCAALHPLANQLQKFFKGDSRLLC
jgi:hypothetical protein